MPGFLIAMSGKVRVSLWVCPRASDVLRYAAVIKRCWMENCTYWRYVSYRDQYFPVTVRETLQWIVELSLQLRVSHVLHIK